MSKNTRKRASSSFETRSAHAPQDEEALHPILTEGAGLSYRGRIDRQWRRAASSAGEHSLHTGGVTGSIPVPPTINDLIFLVH